MKWSQTPVNARSNVSKIPNQDVSRAESEGPLCDGLTSIVGKAKTTVRGLGKEQVGKDDGFLK